MTTRSDQLLPGVMRDGAPRSRSIGRYHPVVWSAAGGKPPAEGQYHPLQKFERL